MWRLLSCILAAIIGLWAAYIFVPGVTVSPLEWQTFVLAGLILGTAHFCIKLLGPFALPFKIITLGFFGLIVNMALVWLLGRIVSNLSAPWFFPLFWTAIILSFSHSLFNALLNKYD